MSGKLSGKLTVAVIPTSPPVVVGPVRPSFSSTPRRLNLLVSFLRAIHKKIPHLHAPIAVPIKPVSCEMHLYYLMFLPYLLLNPHNVLQQAGQIHTTSLRVCTCLLQLRLPLTNIWALITNFPFERHCGSSMSSRAYLSVVVDSGLLWHALCHFSGIFLHSFSTFKRLQIQSCTCFVVNP